MAVNKVVFGNTTVIDITDTTATPDTVQSGVVFHGANGQTMTGTIASPVGEEY